MATAPAIQIGVPRRITWPATLAPQRGTVVPMADPAATEHPGLEAEEARLARAAAEGDGDAFATLYERYAQRAYNLALRLGGSEDDAADAMQEAFVNVLRRLPELDEREFVFRSYLFTATRNAALDLLRRQQRARPSDSIPEGAVPLGSGAGGMGLDPGDPDEDPDRRLLLASQREEIREANARLPERQREALALRELEELSYDEIAAAMEMNRNSVAQLISRARINLRDELRGGALTSVAASSADCERALPLIAMRDDGQLDPDSADADWLDRHLSGCGTCPVAAEAMQEAGASYRLWLPVAVAPWLFRETMARAAEAVGADWSGVREPRSPSHAPGLPAAYRAASGSASAAPGRRARLALAAAGAVLLIGVATTLFAAQLGDATRTEPPRERRPAVAVPAKAPVSVPAPKREPASRNRPVEPDDSEAPAPEPAPVPAPAPEAAASPPSPSASDGGEEPQAQPTTRSGGSVAPTEPIEEEPTQSEPPAPPPPAAPPAEPPPSEPPPVAPPPSSPESPTPGGPPGLAGPASP